jgi:DNA gyrase subunit A
MQRFSLSEVQATAILDMMLRRLAALERSKIKEEYKEKLELIKSLERLLAKPELLRGAVRDELKVVVERFGDKRRTRIVSTTNADALSSGSLLPDEQVWIMIGEKGTVGRAPGASGLNIARRPKEQPLALLQASTRDILYLFSASGRAAGIPIHQLPEVDEIGKGSAWSVLTSLGRNDSLVTGLVLKPNQREEGFLFLTTLGGVVKRVRLEDLPGVTTEPFTVMNVAEDDALGWVKVTGGEDEVVLATAAGMAIRFAEDSVRPMGLPAAGVMGIKLANEADGVIGMDVAYPEGFLWSITDNGLAKATPVDDFPLQGRYGQGVINMRLPKGSTQVAAATVIHKGTSLIITTSGGTTKKLSLSDTVVAGRSAKPAAVLTLAVRSTVTGAVSVGSSRPEAKTVPAKKPREKAKA